MDNINVKKLLKTVEGTVEQYLQWFNGLTPEEQARERKRIVFIHDDTGNGIAIIANGKIYRTSLQGVQGVQGARGYQGYQGYQGGTQLHAVEVTGGHDAEFIIGGGHIHNLSTIIQNVAVNSGNMAFYIPTANPTTSNQYIWVRYSGNTFYQVPFNRASGLMVGIVDTSQPYDIKYSDPFNSSNPSACVGHLLELNVHDLSHSPGNIYKVELRIVGLDTIADASTGNSVEVFRTEYLGYNVWNMGVQGTRGIQGVQGYQGYQGLQGYQGYQGTRGYRGYQGYQGYQGRSFSTSIVHNVTSTDPANWFIPDVSDYFISSNDTGNVFLNKNYLALNSEIHKLSWDQINFTLSGIYDPKVADVSGFLDDLEKNYGYKIYVENDIYTMLTTSTCVLKVKLIQSPEVVAIIECYVDRSVAKI